MNRNFIQRLLVGVFLVACLSLGVQQFTFSDFGKAEGRNEKLEVNSNISSSRMTYGRFLEYLEMGWVKQVDL